MALTITRPVDDTTKCGLAYWEAAFTQIETAVDGNTADIGAIDEYPGQTGSTLKTDVNAVGVNAVTVGGLSASEIGNPDEVHFPRMAETANGGVWTSATYANGKGICRDVNGNVWCGINDGVNCKVAKFAAGRLDTAPTILDLSEAGYRVTELVATRLGVYAILADDSIDGFGIAVTAPGVTGKVAKIDHDTGILDADWGTAGKRDLTSEDPWCACADDTYIWIGCLTSPGEVVILEQADTALQSVITAASNYDYVTALAPYQADGAGDWAFVAGFHNFTVSALGAVCIIGSTTPSFDTYYTTSTDHDQFTGFVSAFGVIVAGINVRATGNKVFAWKASSANGGSGTSLVYTDIGLAASSATLSTTPKICAAPDGTIYIANGTTTGSISRFSSVKSGLLLEETMTIGNGGTEATSIFHDGRHLWILGNDGSQVVVAKLAL